MSTASITSCASSTSIRNPAPHRGFNSKAREVLLDSPTKRGKFARTGSDEEFLRRVQAQRLNRTDSEATSGSQKSQTSSLRSSSPTTYMTQDFDNIDEIPKVKQIQLNSCKLLGDIGKTKSAGDLVKKTAIQRTFQQMNIMKLPSAESDYCYESVRSISLVGISCPTDSDPSYRQSQYEVK